MSKLAVRLNLSSSQVLEHILITPAFTFEHLVELLEHKIADLEDIKLVFISGITALWPKYEQKAFEELLNTKQGIKKIIFRSKPLIVITTPLHKYSTIKSQGGKYLQHFGSVLVLITDEERYIKYRLIQHPSLSEKIQRKWEPKKPKKKVPLKNTTLDEWI